MKEQVHRRTLRPKSGTKGKERPGLIGVIQRTAETEDDVKELLRSAEPIGAVKRLNSIVNICSEILSEFPDEDKGYLIFPNRTWKYLPQEMETASPEDVIDWAKKNHPRSVLNTGIFWNTPLVEPASPEYYAAKARDSARMALKEMNCRELESAVQCAMEAIIYLTKTEFADVYEPLLAREWSRLKAQEKRHSSPSKNYYGQKCYFELAAHLAEACPDLNFESRWEKIPEDEGLRFDGYEVFRKDVDGSSFLVRDREGLPQKRIRKSSFRKYFQN